MLHLPWTGMVSTKFSRDIRSTVQTGFPGTDIRVIFTTTRAFSGRQKYVLSATSQSLVVYEFTCRCGRTYVGKTSQHLSERIKQHVPNKMLTSGSSQRVSKQIPQSPATWRRAASVSTTALLGSFEFSPVRETNNTWMSWKRYTSALGHRSCVVKKTMYVTCYSFKTITELLVSTKTCVHM